MIDNTFDSTFLKGTQRPSCANLYDVCAQHAHPADRFAREILAISVPSGAARSRRLMRHSLGHCHQFDLHESFGGSL
jgi:hypothetical protein